MSRPPLRRLRHVRLVALLLGLLVASPAGPADAQPFAYITNSGSDTVSVIDTATGTFTPVPVGVLPFGVAVNPARTRVYVGNQVDGTVSVIDTATNTVVATVTVGGFPVGVAVNPAGTRAYVANDGEASVSVIDTSVNTVIATIADVGDVEGLAVTPDGSRVYLANCDDDLVTVIDTASNTVMATIQMPAGTFPEGVAVNPPGTRVYVTNFLDASVSVIDTATNTVTATVTVGDGPYGVTVHPDGSRVYVANQNSDTVSVIETSTHAVIATIPTFLGGPPPGGASPTGISIRPDGGRVYVANANLNNVAVIDTVSQTVTEVLAAGSFPQAFGDFIGNGPAATHFAVTAPATATAGVAFTFTVTALDQFDNAATGYTGTVHFTKSDAGAGSSVPADATFVGADAGVKTFTDGATLVTAGNQTLTATDTGSAIGGASGNILVTAAAASRFAVTAPPSVNAGSPFAFDVTALDPFDNVATGYGGTVHFTSSDPLATLPADATLTSGAGTFAATLRTVGPRTITAGDTVSPGITGTSGNIAVAAVTSFSGSSATGSGTIAAAFTGGGAGCTLAAPQFIGPPPGAPPIPPTTPGAGIVFPHGLFLFTTTGCTPGATITITVTYPQSIEGAVYWKYGPTPLDPTPRWYILPATIAGNTATFSITDGGLGDDDRAVNGTIVDQGGPGFPPPIPTLSEWMLIALALLLLATGGRRLRPRRPRTLGGTMST